MSANVLLQDNKNKQHSVQREFENFRTKLTQQGLAPIAVIPEKLWNELCTKFKFIRFENLSDSQTVAPGAAGIARNIFLLVSFIIAGTIVATVIGASLATSLMCLLTGAMVLVIASWLEAKWIKSRQKSSLLLFFAGVSFSTGAGISLFGPLILSHSFVTGISTVISLILALSLGYCSLIFMLEVVVESKAGKLCIGKITYWLPSVLSHREYVKLLFNDWSDKAKTEAYEVMVTVNFAEPPTDVAQKIQLLLDNNYHICVSAVPESITLEGVSEAMAKQLGKDTVVYIKKESMVAIIAQSGELPDEKTLLDEALNITFL